VLVPPGREAAAVAVGGVTTGVGVLVLAAAPTAAVGLVGTALAGAGVSVLAPTLLSAVGARSEPGRQGADLALVTAFGYAGFVLGPLLVGLVSGALSLPVALGLLAVLAVGIAGCGPLLLRTRPRASARSHGAP
jgi:MFS family permease